VEINGRRFSQRRIGVRYGHLPLQLLRPPARARAVSLELATRGRHIGYLPGAGDVPAALEQMGYEVTSLTGADRRRNGCAASTRWSSRHPRGA
jgi:hypothetical protein